MVDIDLLSGFSYAVLSFFETFLTIIGLGLVIYGGIIAAVEVFLHEIGKKSFTYSHIRRQFTDKILFGLEFLIAADIILTVRRPTLDDVLLLGVIVVVRTILGYFLTKEVEEYKFEE